MKYDFDTIIERRGTNCAKYDIAARPDLEQDVLPMWVADMDFQTAPVILQRLNKIVEHGIFGYSSIGKEYFEAVSSWYRRRFDWEVQEDWLVRTPGVVFAIATAVRAFTKPGDHVLIQQPVYYPFGNVVRENGRIVVNNPLRETDGYYEIDFEDFEKKIVDNQVKLFILCSPHNPVSRVWKEEELRRIGDICVKHGVIVVSDEIHADFVYPGYKHTVFASLSPEIAAQSIVCTAPSKTFNLAGLQISNIFISNKELRGKFTGAIKKLGYSETGLMGMAACQAAYEEGEKWLEQLKEYLKGNADYVRQYLKDNIPEVTMSEPEGTYLLWLQRNRTYGNGGLSGSL